MNYNMKYAVVEMDWDECFYDLIALFDDINDAQELVLAIWEEKCYEEFCEFMLYGDEPENTIEEDIKYFFYWLCPEPMDCIFDVKEVPYFGC